MDIAGKEKLCAFLKVTLDKHGDTAALADSDSIFVSGHLDSLFMMMLVMEPEESFGIDFSKVEFEVGHVDSIADMEVLIDANKPGF